MDFRFIGIFLAILLVGVYSEDAGWSDEDEQCVNELHLDKATIKALNDRDISPEDNVDFNKFLACSWKKEGSQKQNGEINWEKVEEIFNEEMESEMKKDPSLVTVLAGGLVANALSECRTKNIHGESHGQTIAKVQNCIMTEIENARR